MNVNYSIMGIIGKFTPLDSSSLNTAINYNPNNNDNYDSKDMAGMNKREVRLAGALGLASGTILDVNSYAFYKSIQDRIKPKIPKEKGEYLFLVVLSIRNSDGSPTWIYTTDRIPTATPESKARFMSLVDRKCSSGQISCASIPALNPDAHNARVYIIASVK